MKWMILDFKQCSNAVVTKIYVYSLSIFFSNQDYYELSKKKQYAAMVI